MNTFTKRKITLASVKNGTKIIIGSDVFAFYGLCGSYQWGDLTTKQFAISTVMGGAILLAAFSLLIYVNKKEVMLKLREEKRTFYAKRRSIFELTPQELFEHLAVRMDTNCPQVRTTKVIGRTAAGYGTIRDAIADWARANGFPYLIVDENAWLNDGSEWFAVDAERMPDSDRLVLFKMKPLGSVAV